MLKLTRTVLVLAVWLMAAAAQAQMTTGTITGRVTDEQGGAIPTATVEATNIETGFTRVDASDGSGVYRLAALPVGSYRLTIMFTGLRRFERQPVTVNVGTTIGVDAVLGIAAREESITVSAANPAISTRSSSVGEVIDLTRIESLPLNGRQFANLAAIVPGVGLGFHSDVSKSAQYTPQISGGNGRNVNFIVDGGDNNDDTVGGLLQMFPLEAVQEFNVLTQRFDAEYGRSDGGVINVVTKSGTNTLRGSGFTLLRDDALNAETETEKNNHVGKQPYQRYQYGGSIGGPIVRDRVHYFAAYERTQQDTKQVVNTQGLFPAEDGVLPVPLRGNLFTGKLTTTLSPSQYLSIRYASDRGSQPVGVGPLNARSAWSNGTNDFDSLNVNHNWVLRGSALNELVVQYSHFLNDTPALNNEPSLLFPNRVSGGSYINPASTEQTKWQYRDDLSWTRSEFGGGHEFRTGVSWVHEPTLRNITAQGLNGIFSYLAPDVNGPISQVLFIGSPTGTVDSNIPVDFYGIYGQDDWRLTNRLTLNLGVRWDYVTGMPVDQGESQNFRLMQAAGAAGRFKGTILDDFGNPTRRDKNNVQPRLGAAYDVRGNGRDVLRGGWGIYTDFGYVNANALTASFDASGGAGIIFSASDPAGLRKDDGTLFRYTDPISSISSQNAANPSLATSGEVVSPLLQEPFTYQSNLGWAHELSSSTSISADYVRVDGRDLNMRIRPNTRVAGRLYLGDIGILPNNNTFKVAVSKGTSRYDALILAIKRRMSRGLDLNASYTNAKATSDVGSASDEIVGNMILDVTQPFAPVQQGPAARTDARHRVTISAVVQAPWGIQVSPIFFYRSALPVQTTEGVDLNRDGNNNDLTALAYRYTGLDDAGHATFEEDGPCETVNCSRRAPYSQLNLRVSKAFRLPHSLRIEAIAEVFNLFNATNPFIGLATARTGAGAPLGTFMQPVAFAGDTGQPEQRIGQLGFRITF